MNQAELLERMWTDVIDAVDPIESIDVQHVARCARYEAVFAWCSSFDEEGIPVAEWLARPADDASWTALVAHAAPAFTRPPAQPPHDAPFADAARAERRLHEANITPSQLAELMTREGRAALAALRRLLASATFEVGELAGLHESLLSADPSGREARSGSWPRSTTSPLPSERLCGARVIGKSHSLAFSPDGLRVIAAKDGAITELETGATVGTCRLLANTAHVAWSRNGRWIVASSTSGAIAICDAGTGARLHSLDRAKEGPPPVFSADGELLFAGDWNGELCAWQIADGRVVAREKLGRVMIQRMALTRRGELVVLVSHRPRPVELVHLSSELRELSRVSLAEPLEDFVLRDDGSAIACGRGWVGRLDIGSGGVSERHAIAARHVALSPDERWCALTTAKGFRIGPSTDLGRGVELEREHASGRAAFSADSRQIALATWNAGEVWDVEALIPAPP